MQQLVRYLWIAVAGALLYCGWQFARRHDTAGGLQLVQRRNAPYSTDEPGSEVSSVKIIQFYAGDGVLTEDSGTLVCYDVVNARAVRLDPPVSAVWPSRNRCFSIQPAGDTRYTLTAEGADGKTVNASLQIRVVPDPESLPKITSFRIESCKRDYLGKPVFRLSFTDQNAEIVSIDPPVLRPLHGAPYGQFYVSPDGTATYTLTVTGKHGHAVKRQLIVDVGACK